MCWVSIGHDCNISSDERVSFSVGSELSEIPTLRDVSLGFCRIVTSRALTVVLLSSWSKWVSWQLRFVTHISFVHCKRLHRV